MRGVAHCSGRAVPVRASCDSSLSAAAPDIHVTIPLDLASAAGSAFRFTLRLDSVTFSAKVATGQCVHRPCAMPPLWWSMHWPHLDFARRALRGYPVVEALTATGDHSRQATGAREIPNPRPGLAATIYEVAEHAGVSIATGSRGITRRCSGSRGHTRARNFFGGGASLYTEPPRPIARSGRANGEWNHPPWLVRSIFRRSRAGLRGDGVRA